MTTQEKEEKLKELRFWYNMHFAGLALALMGAVGITIHTFRLGIIAIVIVLGFEAFFEISTWRKRKELEKA